MACQEAAILAVTYRDAQGIAVVPNIVSRSIPDSRGQLYASLLT